MERQMTGGEGRGMVDLLDAAVMDWICLGAAAFLMLDSKPFKKGEASDRLVAALACIEDVDRSLDTLPGGSGILRDEKARRKALAVYADAADHACSIAKQFGSISALDGLDDISQSAAMHFEYAVDDWVNRAGEIVAGLRRDEVVH